MQKVVSQNGPFSFPYSLPEGRIYNVSVIQAIGRTKESKILICQVQPKFASGRTVRWKEMKPARIHCKWHKNKKGVQQSDRDISQHSDDSGTHRVVTPNCQDSVALMRLGSRMTPTELLSVNQPQELPCHRDFTLLPNQHSHRESVDKSALWNHRRAEAERIYLTEIRGFAGIDVQVDASAPVTTCFVSSTTWYDLGETNTFGPESGLCGSCVGVTICQLSHTNLDKAALYFLVVRAASEGVRQHYHSYSDLVAGQKRIHISVNVSDRAEDLSYLKLSIYVFCIAILIAVCIVHECVFPSSKGLRLRYYLSKSGTLLSDPNAYLSEQRSKLSEKELQGKQVTDSALAASLGEQTPLCIPMQHSDATLG